ncbi:MAG: hypothetical protein QGI46_05980, partial [Planctomycetota bacterium]|nr:hypothetical protein [Planctomycetota bacterium]
AASPAAAQGTTTRVSVDSAGNQGNGDSYRASLSADGRFVGFDSHASNLVGGDTNWDVDIFLHDTLTGATTRVSVDSAGNQGNDWSYEPSLSADGRFVAFYSYASNLVGGDTNGVPDIFLHDTLTGATTRGSVDSAGTQGNGPSYEPSLSADGRFVGFRSHASNLVGGDTNGTRDIFLHDTDGDPPAGTTFCPGDGTGTSCPCSNSGALDHGCGNGTFGQGSRLTASGDPSVSADTVVLDSAFATPGQPGLYFQGDTVLDGGDGVQFGDGLRCAGGVVRLEVVTSNGSGAASSSVRLGASGGVSPGQTRFYQWWYRDPTLSVCGSGFNTSNGVAIYWHP